METKQPHQHVSFVLRDDQSRLASWTVPVDHRLSLYQSVEVPEHFREVLMGYEPRAVVTRIEVNKSSPDHVELQAVCLTKKKHRPVIVLNSARIGGHRRMDIEAYLRSQLTHPLIYWESSTLTNPVVRFNDPATAHNACPSEIRSGILKQIFQSDDVRAA